LSLLVDLARRHKGTEGLGTMRDPGNYRCGGRDALSDITCSYSKRLACCCSSESGRALPALSDCIKVTSDNARSACRRLLLRWGGTRTNGSCAFWPTASHICHSRWLRFFASYCRRRAGKVACKRSGNTGSGSDRVITAE